MCLVLLLINIFNDCIVVHHWNIESSTLICFFTNMRSFWWWLQFVFLLNINNSSLWKCNIKLTIKCVWWMSIRNYSWALNYGFHTWCVPVGVDNKWKTPLYHGQLNYLYYLDGKYSFMLCLHKTQHTLQIGNMKNTLIGY